MTEWGVEYAYPDRTFISQGYTEAGARKQVRSDRSGFAPMPSRVVTRECSAWVPVDEAQEGTA